MPDDESVPLRDFRRVDLFFNGQPLPQQCNTLFGLPVVEVDDLPEFDAGEMVLGDWSAYMEFRLVGKGAGMLRVFRRLAGGVVLFALLSVCVGTSIIAGLKSGWPWWACPVAVFFAILAGLVVARATWWLFFDD